MSQSLGAQNTNFVDSKYFSVLGQILVNSVPKSGYKSYNEIPVELLSLCRQISFDDILLWFSPSVDSKYSALESLIVQIIINSDSSNIPKPSTMIYIRLVNAGFHEQSITLLIPKLLSICSESEFIEYESRIFEKYLVAEPETSIKLLSENRQMTYNFIKSYIRNKYSISILKWNKLAIIKGALDVIYDYNLVLTSDDILYINKNYCSIENITLYKKYKSSWETKYPTLFNGFVQLDDFLRVNGITDADHTKINYAKYLDILNINDGNTYFIPVCRTIKNYHPALAQQFLEYILVRGDILAQTQIGFEEKLVYIKEKLLTKEYTSKDIAEFINKSVYYYKFVDSDVNKPRMTFDKIIEQIELAGIQIPWEILINGLSNSYITGFIKWPIARNYVIPEKHFDINTYIMYLKGLQSANDWTPSIQMEYWKIFNSCSQWLSNFEKERLIQQLPVEIIQNIPVTEIYNLRLYLHYNFGEVIKDNKNGIRNDLALILKSKLTLEFKPVKKILSKSESPYLTEKLREIGQIICRHYSNDLDILKYFNVQGIAEVMYRTNKYHSFSVDVLVNLITLTSNQTIIQAYQREIDRILKKDETDKHLAEFAGLFQIDGDIACNHTASNCDELARAVARLVNAVNQRPVKYWLEDDYRHACNLKLITPQILAEFKQTQPVPHPDFNWRTLTILLATDQIIQEYQWLPWQLPVYTKSNSHKLLESVNWDYFKDRTMLFSHDSELWTKFSTKLPMDFILQRINNNYRFQWHSIITREDFKPTAAQWQEIKPKLRAKDLRLHPNRYDINMIINNLDLGWDLRQVIKTRTIPLKYLPKLLHKSKFNKSLLDDRHQQKSEAEISIELQNLRRKIILSSLVAGLDELKQQCRIANYLFGDRPHIEKMVLGFATQCLLS